MPKKRKEMNNIVSRKKKWIDRFFIVLPLIAILGLVISFKEFRSGIREMHVSHFQNFFKENAKHKLMDMNDLLNKMVCHLENTANLINEYDDFNHPDVRKILQFSNEINWFEYTVVSDPQGNAFDNAGNIVNVSDREYFQNAMKGNVAFSEMMDSKVIEGDQVQIIAHPIRTEDDEVRGVVFGVLNTNNFKNTGFGGGPEVYESTYIVDSRGEYIAQFQNNEKMMITDNFWLDARELALGEEKINQMKSDFDTRTAGEFTYIIEGTERYVCYIPIGPNKWQLIYAVSAKPVEQIVCSVYSLDNRNTLMVTLCYSLLLFSVFWHFKKANDKIRKANQEAKTNMEFMRISIEHSKHIVFEYDQNRGEIHLKTDIRNKLFDQTSISSVPDSLIAKNLIDKNSIPAFEGLFNDIKTEGTGSAEIKINAEGDKETWYRITMNNVYNKNNVIADAVGIVEDISDIKAYELEMHRNLQIYNTLIANAIVYAKVDLTSDMILELNGKKEEISFENFLRERITKTVSPEQISYVEQELSLEALKKAYDEGKDSVEVQFRRAENNETRWVSCVVRRLYGDDTSKVLFVVTDIDKQKREEIRLKQRAERDGLTGLYNAETTRQKVNEILSHQYSENTNQVLVLFDLDNYKQINDTFGHGYGDQVLKDVAKTLNSRFRSSDVIGRIGGDEFVVLLRDMKGCDYAETLIEELRQSLKRTYRVQDKEVSISASIGVAVAPYDGITYDELYKKSDIAQYRVKKNSKDAYQFYKI